MSAEEVSLEQGAVDLAVTDVVDKMKRMADGLRRMADVIDERSSHRARIEQDPSYEASQVAHELVWGVANLKLDLLLAATGRVHQYKSARDSQEKKNV